MTERQPDGMGGKLVNTPNKLTLLRVALVPFFILFLLGDFIPFHTLWALLVFVVASFTDLLDGKIARSQNMVTNFGKFLDPLADKILVISGLICFVQMGLSDAVVVIIIVAREFLVTSLRLVAADSGNVIAASGLGKLKTAFTMAAMIGVMLLAILRDFSLLPAGFPLFYVSEVLLWIAVVLTIVSGTDYLLKNWSSIDMKK